MSFKGGMSILDALENLNTLVDASSLDEIEVGENALLIAHKRGEKAKEGEIYWVQAGGDYQTQEAIKETFRTVYEYLQAYYQKMKEASDTKRLIEGINTIMVLVGEAAKKLDRFGALFRERVADFKEYQDLQNFYRNKVIKESFQQFAKIGIPHEEKVSVPREEWEQQLKENFHEEQTEISDTQGVHILDDVNVVKRDHLYELFYLKNEEGHRFFTFELARHIKLACDFGEFFQEYFSDDPLLQIKNFEDKELHLLAQKILKECQVPIEKFYKQALKNVEMEMIKNAHKALMALNLAANPRNLIRQFSVKGCHLYFKDFLVFLRQALHSREWQKYLIYSTAEEEAFIQNTLSLVYRICHTLFTLKHDKSELQQSLSQLIIPKLQAPLSDALLHSYQTLTAALKAHPSGPLFKAVDIVRDEEEYVFDPLFQGCLPVYVCGLIQADKEIGMLHMPCPIKQEWINHAEILEEFKTYLRSLSKDEQLLCIHFADRTSWKEYARAHALEELSRVAEFAPLLTVVTFAKDTEFYNQTGSYEQENHAEHFIDYFSHHLQDESTGYFFPQTIKNAVLSSFIDPVLLAIHQTFFDGKQELSYLDRLDFIQIAYHLIELKMIEVCSPSLIAHTSKDGLDSAASASVGLIAFLEVGRKEHWDKKEQEALMQILFADTLMQRERAIQDSDFERLQSMVKLLETKGNYLSSFKSLFKPETLAIKVII